MQPAKIRAHFSADEIRTWFEAADGNGDGVLSINEFFVWSLGNAAQKHGMAALQNVFAKYDKDKTGFLDAIEFGQAAAEMGFGAAAHDIFRGLDDDGSGTVSYRELVAALTAEVPTDPSTKKMLTAMVCSWTEEGELGQEQRERLKTLDTSKWSIRGLDPKSVRKELQALLEHSGGHVADLIKLFDDDADHSLLIDDMEFAKAMRNKFGYRGTKAVIDDVFASIDLDGAPPARGLESAVVPTERCAPRVLARARSRRLGQDRLRRALRIRAGAPPLARPPQQAHPRDDIQVPPRPDDGQHRLERRDAAADGAADAAALPRRRGRPDARVGPQWRLRAQPARVPGADARALPPRA